MESEICIKEKKGILDLAMDEKLRQAFLKHREEKRKKSPEEVAEMVSYITGSQCVRDLQRLKNGDYYMEPPMHFQVPKNFSGRKRDIFGWKGTTKYLLSLLSFVLRDFDHIFSDGLYSFRKTKTAKDFLLKLRRFSDAHTYYAVKADVSNYVCSAVPEILVAQLEEIWKEDPEFLNFMKFLLLRREYIESDGSLVKGETGGLGGSPLGNLFMNVYLMEMDDYYQPRSPLYCRYSDDLLIFARDKEQAQEFIDFFYHMLEKKKLSTNPEKTMLLEPGSSVEILGCVLENGKLDISDHAKQKLKRKIRVHANRELKLKKEWKLSNEEAAVRQSAYCSRLFFGTDVGNGLSWAKWLFPVISETKSLNELDQFAKDSIRYVYWGTFSAKRFRTGYEDLKRYGYRSLVHAYYHYEH